MKSSKSDGWTSLKLWRTQNHMVEIRENIELCEIWRLKLPNTLKCFKSDGWRSLKRWRKQNLIVELTENIELHEMWLLKLQET